MGQLITLIDNENVKLVFHPDHGIVHHQFHRPALGQMFRDTLTAGAAAMKKYGGSKWLSDDRANRALGQEDADWARTVWVPEAVKSGWKHWAVVMPEKVVGQLNMQRFIAENRAAGINARPFSDPAEALKWLISQ